MKNKYIPPDYNTDIDDGIFDYTNYGNCFFKRTPERFKHHTRSDIILFDNKIHSSELHNNVNIGTLANSDMKQSVLQLIQNNWYHKKHI